MSHPDPNHEPNNPNPNPNCWAMTRSWWSPLPICSYCVAIYKVIDSNMSRHSGCHTRSMERSKAPKIVEDAILLRPRCTYHQGLLFPSPDKLPITPLVTTQDAGGTI